MKKIFGLVMFFTILLGAAAFGADGAAAPSGVIASVTAFIAKVAGAIPLSGMIVVVLAGAYDMARRKFPTAVPASLPRDIQALIRKLSGYLLQAIQPIQALVALLQKLDQFIDQVVGQNVVPPQQ